MIMKNDIKTSIIKAKNDCDTAGLTVTKIAIKMALNANMMISSHHECSWYSAYLRVSKVNECVSKVLNIILVK